MQTKHDIATHLYAFHGQQRAGGSLTKLFTRQELLDLHAREHFQVSELFALGGKHAHQHEVN